MITLWTEQTFSATFTTKLALSFYVLVLFRTYNNNKLIHPTWDIVKKVPHWGTELFEDMKLELLWVDLKSGAETAGKGYEGLRRAGIMGAE